jgi:hypothetical protein
VQFWKRPAKTSGDEHAAALSRTSDDWAGEIQRLRSELDEIAVTRAALTGQAGRAALDRQDALTTDLASQLAALTTREQIVNAAIRAAEDRQHDAEADEERRRLSSQLREHYGLLADYCAASAVVKQAEGALAVAVQARRPAACRTARPSGRR